MSKTVSKTKHSRKNSPQFEGKEGNIPENEVKATQPYISELGRIKADILTREGDIKNQNSLLVDAVGELLRKQSELEGIRKVHNALADFLGAEHIDKLYISGLSEALSYEDPEETCAETCETKSPVPEPKSPEPKAAAPVDPFRDFPFPRYPNTHPEDFRPVRPSRPYPSFPFHGDFYRVDQNRTSMDTNRTPRIVLFNRG